MKIGLSNEISISKVQNHFARGGFYKLFFSKYPSCNNPCNNEIVGFPINIHVLWIPSFHSMEIIIILIFDFLCAPVNTFNTMQMNFDRTIVKSKKKKKNGFIFLKSKSIEWNPESDIFYKILSPKFHWFCWNLFSDPAEIVFRRPVHFKRYNTCLF